MVHSRSPRGKAAAPRCHRGSPQAPVPSAPALLGTAGSCSLPSCSTAPFIRHVTSSLSRGSLQDRWVSSGGQGLRVTAVLLEAFWHAWALLACWSTAFSETLLYLMSSKGNSDSYVPWNLQSVPQSLFKKARFLLNTQGLILAHVLEMDAIAIQVEKGSHLPRALQTRADGCFHLKNAVRAVTTGSQQGWSSGRDRSQPSPWQRSLWMFVNTKCIQCASHL